MSSLQQSNRFILYKNNVQRTQHLSGQGSGFLQNLSDSETDVSTSTENLSHEERYVIRHTARQEPQGQENLSSNRSSLDVSSSSYNTLIIHGAGDEPWTGRVSGLRDTQDSTSPSFLSSIQGNHAGTIPGDSKTIVQGQKLGSHSPSPSVSSSKEPSTRNNFEMNTNRFFDPSVREITDIPDDYLNQSQVLKHLAKEVKVIPSSGNGGCSSEESDAVENICVPDQIKRLSIARIAPGGCSSKVAGSKMEPNSLTLEYRISTPPPPPEYPDWKEIVSLLPVQKIKLSHITSEKLSLSKSQPDLSRVGTGANSEDVSVPTNVATSPRPKTHGSEDTDSPGREIWPPAEMVEILMQENSSLKAELETCLQKVAKSQKLEQEISKIHHAHEELVQSSERRERLERAARARLQGEIRRLHELNKGLREQISTQILTGRSQNQSDIADMATENLRKELGKREILIAQIKELAAAKERQEIELAAQRATLQEQRTHIDILDTALTNAQSNVVRLEEECRKKQIYVERVAQLQRALSSLQLASDRREQTERKLRLQLERELRSERSRVGIGTLGGGEGDADEEDTIGSTNGSQNVTQSGETAAELKRKLRERDEKLMRLEGEVAKWEQRYLEESALRQAAIDAASIPKDAKIAALEKTSQETEKLIAEARSEKIRHMDEVHAAQKKVADLESKVKDLESKLAERDAMIRVLQKHTYDKEASSSAYPSMLGRSPHHTPHPSLHGNSDIGGVLVTSVSREDLDPVSTTSVFSTVSSVLTSSCSTGISSYAGSDSGAYHHPLGSSSFSTRKYGSTTNQSFDNTKKSLDDQLKELDSQLDSQLLSKRALCCFPGFTNTSSTPRKGKIPKPLLTGVGGASPHHLFEPSFLQGLVPNRYEQGRPEEILLLEKQGRSSQQQRMQETCMGGAPNIRIRSGSLPPSSLPRPHRTHKPNGGKERRLGEYGRLSDSEGRKTPATSEGSDTMRGSKERDSSARSLLPAPRKLGEYGRLNDSESRCSRKSGNGEHKGKTRASNSTKNNEESNLRLFSGPCSHRSSSFTRDNKPGSADSSSAKSIASTVPDLNVSTVKLLKKADEKTSNSGSSEKSLRQLKISPPSTVENINFNINEPDGNQNKPEEVSSKTQEDSHILDGLPEDQENKINEPETSTYVETNAEQSLTSSSNEAMQHLEIDTNLTDFGGHLMGDLSSVKLLEPPTTAWKIISITENDVTELTDQALTSVHRKHFDNTEDSHFFAYFIAMVAICVLAYLMYHNKHKFLALILEGRRRRELRRTSHGGYRKLDSTLEEAVTSTCSTSVTHVIY